MSLKDKIKSLPKNPGVYLMKNVRGSIIYVGKAKNLKNRVTSYFSNSEQQPKTKALVKEISDFELMLTQNEIEAFLLERTLIKHHRPHYNILLQDDKEFPLIRVDLNEPWPRIKKVRRRKDDDAVYIGPFSNVGLLNIMIKMIYKVFPLIHCSPHEFKTANRACNYYHMKLCLAPCVKTIDRKIYINMIENAIALLQGKNQELAIDLKKKMMEASESQEYELAAHYRDQLTALESMRQKQSVIIQNLGDADAIAVFEGNDILIFHVLMIRDSQLLGGENYVLPLPAESKEESLSSFILQYYDQRIVPDKLLLPFNAAGIDELALLLSEDRNKKVIWKVPKSGDELALVKLSTKNAAQRNHEIVTKSNQRRVESEMVMEILNLNKAPSRIECIDISNFQKTAIVASNVVFINGKPDKSKYRHYNIKSLTENHDDYASIKEVVTRRIERGLRDDDLPELLVIDGGKGQLSSAIEARKLFPDLDLPIVAIAKSKVKRDPTSKIVNRTDERVFKPGESNPIILKEGSPVYRILTSIRDESHRFAISFHRKKRSAISQGSVLEQVPGIGPVLRKRLLEKFSGLEGLQDASLEDILEVKGVTQSAAVALHSALQSLSDDKNK